MIELLPGGTYLLSGQVIIKDDEITQDNMNCCLVRAGLKPLNEVEISLDQARKGTIAYRILTDHNLKTSWPWQIF